MQPGGIHLQPLSISGDVFKVGTPANNQIGVWTGDGTIEGDANLLWDGSNFIVVGDIVGTSDIFGPTIQASIEFLFTERADHNFPPTATRGIMWVRNDVPNVLMYTDDAGTDFVLNDAFVGPSTVPSSVLRGDGAGGWIEELSATIDAFGVFTGGGLVSSGVVTLTELAGANSFINVIAGGIMISGPAGGTTHWEISGQVRFEGDRYDVQKAAPSASFADMGSFWVRDDVPNTPMYTDNFGNDLELIGATVAGSAQEVAVFNSDNQIQGNDNFQFDASVQSGRVEIKCVDNVINNIGLFLIDPNSVLNPDGWQFCTGQAGLFDGSFILTHKPADTINNRDVTFLPGNRPTFGFGIAVAPDTSLGDENAGSLAYFMPRDISGREETKISFVGEVGGTGHEGVFSIEGFAYGNSGLQFARLAHFVIDNDYRLHIDLLGVLIMSGATALEAGEDGICRNLVDGLQIQGQGSSRDVTMYDDSHQITLSSQTGTSAWRFHKRFQNTTYVEFHMNNATDDFEITGAGACDNILWTGYDGLFSIDSDLTVTGAILAQSNRDVLKLAAMRA